ncbi:TadE/TadG family type IV pilus assembly protein [Ornithinimicrobium kibberense]|uniref:TadE/TadG family type IV pilus assembly protein n=1 Tax=Ornithinimicrobium kibberense TaxID=282060 RepID=A0ABV5V301_9MICO
MRAQGDRGAAVVEFALIFLLLFSMFIAVLEGGRLFFLQASLGSAARDAARVLAIGGDQAEALARANDAFPFGSVAWDSANSAACPPPPAPDQSATASLTYSTGMITGFWPTTFTLRGTGAMRCNG